MGEILQYATEKDGTAYRIGGDEFVILVQDKTGKKSQRVQERLELMAQDFNKGDEYPI
jgi:GGDEF domain-containing protein